jgi:hypothetical protein
MIVCVNLEKKEDGKETLKNMLNNLNMKEEPPGLCI